MDCLKKELGNSKASEGANAMGAFEAEAESDIADGQQTPDTVSEVVDISVLQVDIAADEQPQVGIVELLA